MVKEIVILRHGESEWNLALKAALNGDTSGVAENILLHHGSRWRLTDRGVEQAKAAGIVIKEVIGVSFDRYYVSAFIRAQETAYHLDLPDAQWNIEPDLAERDDGYVESLTRTQRRDRFPHAFHNKDVAGVYWSPPGGESHLHVRSRVRNFFDRMMYAGKPRIIVVGHGVSVRALRSISENHTVERFAQTTRPSDPQHKVEFCHIFHYSRINPDTGNCEEDKWWLRRIAPHQEISDWQLVCNKGLSNADLLENVEQAPYLIRQNE